MKEPDRLYSGSKLALIKGDELLVYLRDEKHDIPYPGYWDLPGGGREGDELPEECAVRETLEEFGIHIDPASFVFSKEHDSTSLDNQGAYFFVAPITDAMIAEIVFGDEGQFWKMMKIVDFLSDPNSPPHLKHRVADFLVASALPTADLP
ncbi:MAG: NUDIX hydrolase [Brevirhabdus sp.]